MSYTRPAYDAADASWEGAATYTRPAYNEADASWEESTPAITADAVIAIAHTGGIPANVAASIERAIAINASSVLLLELDGQPQDIQATLFAQLELSRNDAKSQVLLLDSWSPVFGEVTNAISLEFLQELSQAEQLTVFRDSPVAKDVAFAIESFISSTFSLELPIRFEELIGAIITVLAERHTAVNAFTGFPISSEERHNRETTVFLESLLEEKLLEIITVERGGGIGKLANLLFEVQAQLTCDTVLHFVLVRQHSKANNFFIELGQQGLEQSLPLPLENNTSSDTEVDLFFTTDYQHFKVNAFAVLLSSRQEKTNAFTLETSAEQFGYFALIPIEQLYGDGSSILFSLEKFANVNVTHTFWLDVDTRNAAVLCTDLQKLGISYELAAQLSETALTTGMLLVELSTSMMSSEFQQGSVERLLRHNTLTVH